ncbi:MAG TPA: flagellar hook protein FlgE [Burkholderiales bacterium]|nr:flagellar hook protein FlgE [Burkholderiales bacterium]
MSFQQGLSGLNAAAKNLDVIGNNVANANTVGFKSSSAEFSDVYANTLAGGGTQIGIGTALTTVAQQFTQGNINVTNSPLDLAINGQGFFRMDVNGAVSYTRNGQFSQDKDGYIVNSTGAFLTGYAASPTGVLATAAPGKLQISTAPINPQPTTQAAVVANLDARSSALPAAGFVITDPSTYHNATSLSVFDSQGNAHSLSLYFTKTAANTWSVFGAGDGTQIGAGALGTLAFQTDGSIDTAASTFPSTVNVPVTTGAATPIAVQLDFTGSTQFGDSFGVSKVTQDGFTSGRLAGFSVSGDGTILARYSNGQSRAQGQVALATFNNPNGLQPLGNNLLAETAASGQALVGAPGSANLGVLQSGAVEDSNVDLTAELVDMITAQRVYQANAQSIKTQDAVLQTLVNLR